MGKETAKDMSGKTDQRFVNHIEKKLSAMGGSMMAEMGADLALKFGGWYKAFLKASDFGASLEEDIATKKIVGDDQIRAVHLKAKEMKRQAAEQRSKENADYTAIVKKYITEVYGEEKRKIVGEPNSPIIGYGDRIEIEKNHLKKIW